MSWLYQPLPLAGPTSTGVSAGLATETDSALAVAVGGIDVGIADETDTPLALVTEYPLGLAEETDSALAVGRAVILGLATETDSALSATPFLTFALPVETDEALHLAVPIGLLIETDSALGLRPVRAYALGLTEETDSVLALTLLQGFAEPVGLATETDTALAHLIRNLGLASETDEALGVQSLQVPYWPFDDLQPRHIGIHPCAAPIGGGPSIGGKEPTKDSGNGYWRIVYGGVPVTNRDRVFLWRWLEAWLEGRGRPVIIYIYDGKRAPWPGEPGGLLTAIANASAAAGATSIEIDATGLAALQVGMGFSTELHRYHWIKAITSTVGSVYTCTIFPKLRHDVAAGADLEFGRPTLIVRQEDDKGMNLPLELLKRGDGNVAFIEDVR